MQRVSSEIALSLLAGIDGDHKTPVYNMLLLGEASEVWLSPPAAAARPAVADLFVCITVSRYHVRSYCSYEDNAACASLDQAGELYAASLHEYRSRHAKDGNDIKFGAVNSIFVPFLTRPPLNLRVNHDKLWDVFLSPQPSHPSSHQASDSTLLQVLDDIGELYFDTVHPDDFDLVLSSSEIAHSQEYLEALRPRSSAIYLRPGPHHDTSSRPSSYTGDTGDPTDRARDEGRDRLIAHVFLSPDGSIGTLHVDPSFRRRGLAQRVVRHRLAALSNLPTTHDPTSDSVAQAQDKEQGASEKATTQGVRPYACVGETNERSSALMRSLGFEKRWKVAWLVSSGDAAA